MGVTVAELAERLGAQLVGVPAAGAREIVAVMPAAAAGVNDVTFVTDSKHEGAAAASAAAAVLVAKPIDGLAAPQLVVEDVNAALIQVLRLFAPPLKPPVEGVDSSARLGVGVRLRIVPVETRVSDDLVDEHSRGAIRNAAVAGVDRRRRAHKISGVGSGVGSVRESGHGFISGTSRRSGTSIIEATGRRRQRQIVCRQVDLRRTAVRHHHGRRLRIDDLRDDEVG